MKLHNLFDLYKLQKNQWKSPHSIKKIQEKKLKKLIYHAYQNVLYYQKLFDSLKIKPKDIRKIEDLQILPIISKKQLQDLPLKEKIAKNIDPKQCKSLATSGTTGIPLKMFFTLQDSTLMNLSWARVFFSCGMKPWYKMIAFIGQQNVSKRKSWYEHFGLWRRKETSTWNKPEDWIEEIREWKPEVLIGYVMTLKLLGEAIQKYQMKNITPKIIFHSSALLDDFSRQFLKSVFKSKIIDIYGSDEGGCIAWECGKCSGYHICSDMVIVEILKNGKPVSPGEEGEVVITNLHSYAMPFIRYKQEDIVTLSNEKPICGRGFPLLEHIEGRTDDFIVLRNGWKISPHPFYHCMDPVPSVRRWRIIQENINKLKVEIEPIKNFNSDTQQIIDNNLKKLVGNKIEIKIFLVDSIPIDSSSKFRVVSSKIGRNF